ncbi:MAG: hypothetical protein H6711_27510 [Myxococcales bacterium]|nr:hypothetical protein [Myxococcales bacterium]
MMRALRTMIASRSLAFVGLVGLVGCDGEGDELGHASVEDDEGEAEAEAAARSGDPIEPSAADLEAGRFRRSPLELARELVDFAIPGAPPTAVTKAPLPAAYCQINVNGVLHDTETDYIPHVITCENGGANLEALKAQAIAARSVAYYAMAENGKICDGQGCQVYTCGAQPGAKAMQAAAETAGMYLSYNNTIKGRVLTYAFYVAGDNDQTAGCKGVDPAAGTEKFVTYNEGKTGTNVKETTLGFQFKDPNNYGYGQNRGCMGQWSARCLENNKGYDYKKILQYFYGADIEIQQAAGPCVGPTNEEPVGVLESADCQGIRGWAHDADVGEPAIDVVLSFGGPLDDPQAVQISMSAGEPRPDLCGQLGSCDHGFSIAGPRSLRDAQPHPIHAYAEDDADNALVEIDASPKDFACAPPTIPDGVRRLVGDAALSGWGFDPFWQMAVVPDASLLKYPEWKAIGELPQLIQATGAPEVWLVDLGFRRHVPSPEVAAAWGFDLGQVAQWPPAMVEALPIGTPVRDEVFLIRGDGPAIYLLDDPLCPEGGIPGDPFCPADGGTTGGDTDSGGTSSGGGSSSGSSVSDSASASGGGTSGDGGTGSSGDTAGDSATSAGDDGPTPSLPPGYGFVDGDGEGCACSTTSGGPAGAGLGLLALLALGRRRRE